MFRGSIEIILLFGALAVFIVPSNSARILGLFPSSSQSHLLIHSAIADALAERGHNVTVIATFPAVKKNPPYRFIQLDINAPSAFSEFVTNPPAWYSYRHITAFKDHLNNYANESLNHPALRKLMDEESFDLVVQGYFFNDFLLGVAAHFKCPVVLSFMVRPFPCVSRLVGNPLEIAYVPSLIGGGKQPMGFIDRLMNFLYIILFENGAQDIYAQWQQSVIYKKNFPSPLYPPFEEITKNVSLVLLNHHFTQETIRPDIPAMVEIGGIQIKEKPDPLPEDIQVILDNATNGVIYFSLGSNIKPAHLGDANIKILFNVLSKLPQTVLWKWSDYELPGNSSNIFFKTWLPQDDILAHPHVKLFITHGGQGSVVEAQYHGVPMVGLPMIADQPSNIKNVERLGFGLSVDLTTLSEEVFRKTLLEVLTNKKYTEKIQRFSKLYRDRPMTARQTAVFWIEYVLRHHGAPHMQSPAVHLNAFQLLSLDVIGSIVLIVYIFVKVIRIIFSCMLSVFRVKKNKLE